ncbi:MAG: carbon monoxide dehydrogenase [Pseudomonadales bacterium]|nr:carbon monoxide dehydrogenase [Pseudomonadales bacterium]
MEQSGEYDIPAARETVWIALNDPDVLGQCITGCQEVARTDDLNFDVKVKAKVGPVSAMFQAALELDELDPPSSYRIRGGVKGGAAGFAKGEASVQLAEIDASNTKLTYQVKASVGGKLAQVGSRLVDGATRKMADEFFSAFRDYVRADSGESAEGSEGSEGVDVPARVADVSVEQSDKPKYETAGGGTIWIIAFVVLALAMLFAI